MPVLPQRQLLLPLERRLLPLIALCVLACGPATPPDDGPGEAECAAQTDCGNDIERVCLNGKCETLAENEQRTLRVAVSEINWLNPKAVRAVVLHPMGPVTSAVRCADVGSIEDALNQARFNRTSYPIEVNISGPKGTHVRTSIGLNGPARLIYVEVYAEQIRQSEPGSEGPPIGRGCLDGAPFTPGNSDEAVIVDISPVS